MPVPDGHTVLCMFSTSADCTHVCAGAADDGAVLWVHVAVLGLRRLVVAAGCVWMLAWAPPAAGAPALDGISARPVDDAGQSTGEPYFEEVRAPGELVMRRLAIKNAGARSARLWIDAVDASTGSRGGTAFAHRDAPDRAVGKWIRPSKNLLQLPAGEERLVTVALRVPADARPGDHVGGVAIEPLRRATSEGQLAVTQVLRVVIAAHIRVRGTSQRSLVPKVLRLERTSGSKVPALSVRLTNRGDRLCKPVLVVELSQRGSLVSAERRQLDTVLPQSTIDFPVYWPRGLRPGRYDATVRTTDCGEARQDRRVVKLAGDAAGATIAASAATAAVGPGPGGGGVPVWASVALVLLAVVLLLAALRWRAVRRQPPPLS